MNLVKQLSPLVATGLIPVMIASVGCNREKELTFDDWDKNNNNKIELDEFTNTFIPNYYDDWNTTDNDYLDDEDFYQVSFVLWDTDNDNHLSEEEYMMGYTHNFGDYTISEYDVIDLNADKKISYEEYKNSIIDSYYYADWDMNDNNELSKEELAVGLFDSWDHNNDLIIDQDEYIAFDSYYLDI